MLGPGDSTPSQTRTTFTQGTWNLTEEANTRKQHENLLRDGSPGIHWTPDDGPNLTPGVGGKLAQWSQDEGETREVPREHKETRASLVIQWLRIPLPMQGTQVRSLVQEVSTCRRPTKPVCHNDCSLRGLELVFHERSHHSEMLLRRESSPCLLQLEKKARPTAKTQHSWK